MTRIAKRIGMMTIVATALWLALAGTNAFAQQPGGTPAVAPTAAAAGATTASAPAKPPVALTLKKGDRLAIVGDSITEQKLYSRYMEDYLAACTPQLDLWIIQLGWGGETASGFLGRMDMDMLSLKPTVATTCYGMNDGGYHAYDENTGKGYEKAMRTLIERAKAAGVRMVVGTPGAVDTKYSKIAEAYNDSLGRLGQIDRVLAGEYGTAFADVHAPLMAAMAASKGQFGADYPVCGRDGVHPPPNGHIIMAYAFLKGLGLDGQLGTITVDMAGTAQATDGHKVLSSAPGSAEIESTRYPFCFYGDDKSPDSTRSILPFVPFNQELNRLMLVVKNLKSDKAKVAWGEATKTFTRDELAKGVNLGAEFLDNPFSEAFKKVDEAVARKQGYETGMIKSSYHALADLKKNLDADPEAATAVQTLADKLNAKQTALGAAVRAAVVPVKHKITVTAE
jgi:lysophospholipase L1-like esterase